MENTTETPIEGEPEFSGPEFADGPEPMGPEPAGTDPGGTKSTPLNTELRRPKNGRMLAGVAAGIADRVGVDRWVIRLAFLVLFFGGGAGLLLYIAGWLLIPEEGETESLGQRWANQANSTRPWVGVILVVVAAAILFSNFPFFDGGLLFPTALLVIGILLYRGDLPGIDWKPRPHPDKTAPGPTTTETITAMTANFDSPTITQPIAPVVIKPRTPPSPLGQITVGATAMALGLLGAIDRLSPAIDADARHYFALAVAILGLGTLIGTFYGRARWLIPIGLLLVPPMVGASVVASFDGNWRSPQLVRPSQFAGLATMYEKGAGELVIDLTELPWSGETITVNAELGVGALELRVPAGVGVEASGDVGIGEFAIDSISEGDSTSDGGFGIDRTFSVEGSGQGMVIANLEVGIGRIVVEVDDDRLFDGGNPATSGVFGDLVIDVNSTEALEDSYATSEGDITLDLAGLDLTSDKSVEVASDLGDITVILPPDTSYRVEAHTDSGVVDLFGEDRVESGGSVRADFSTEGPVIELIIQSIEGDIILTQGDRS